MIDIFAMRGFTVFDPKILFRYQLLCRHAHENVSFACMNSVLMKLSTRVVNWHSNTLGYPPNDGSRYYQFPHNVFCSKVMVITLGMFE